MFKEILDLFKKHTTLEAVEHEFDTMLEIAQQQFEKATASLDNAQKEGDKDWIWESDREINRLQQSIRRKLYTHLLVNGKQDLAASMAFISIIKDAERLGDFSKNIYQVFDNAGEIHPAECHAKMLRLRRHIILQFIHVREVLKTHEEGRAKEIVAKSIRDQEECNSYIWTLVAKDESLIKCENPVAAALLFRFYKRVLSHLINTATAVYMPLHKLDAFDEPPEL